MSVVLYSTWEAATCSTCYGWAYLMLWVIKLKSLRWCYEFFVRCYRWILSTAHFAQEAAQDFCNQLYVFFGHTFNFIQLHSTALLWTKTSPNKQFKLSILLLPWVLSGILVVPNVFLNCSEQSGMIPMANCCKTDGNKTTIIIAYYDKIQENTSINAVL